MKIFKNKKNNGEKNNISQDNTTKQIAFYHISQIYCLFHLALEKEKDQVYLKVLFHLHYNK